MYLPKYYQEDDTNKLAAFMRQNSFATLVSTLEGELVATHLPIVTILKGDEMTLLGHVARANSQALGFGKGEALAIFSGPHAYVSPTLYEKEESVPTWNYVAVHAHGVPQPLTFKEEPDALQALMDITMDAYEPSYRAQWEGLGEKYRNGMMSGIIGFEMKVIKLYGKYKLSQNRSRSDQQSVATTLAAQQDKAAAEIGDLMKERLERS